MSNVMSPPAISMPAWWDPKNRKAVWNPHSIVPGILIISGGSIAFVTPGTAVFNHPLKGNSTFTEDLVGGLFLLLQDYVRLHHLPSVPHRSAGRAKAL